MRAISIATAILCASADVYFEEDFSGDWEKTWILGQPKGMEMGKWGLTFGKWFVDEDVNRGLQPMEDMRFYSISAMMDKPATTRSKTLVLQFSAKIGNHQSEG